MNCLPCLQPASNVSSPKPPRREFVDSRQAVLPKPKRDEDDRDAIKKALQQPLAPGRRRESNGSVSSADGFSRQASPFSRQASPFSRQSSPCGRQTSPMSAGSADGAGEQKPGRLDCLGRICFGEKKKDEPEKEGMRRWYRVHPISDELYYVRPDAGLAGRTPGHPDAGGLTRGSPKAQSELDLRAAAGDGEDPVMSNLKKCKNSRISVPDNLDRMLALPEPSLNDTFTNWCKICYSKQADVVVLPCRHGSMCESCLRISLLSRPAHRGGRQCPFCRKKIEEVIKLYRDAAINMYGYAINIGLFLK